MSFHARIIKECINKQLVDSHVQTYATPTNSDGFCSAISLVEKTTLGSGHSGTSLKCARWRGLSCFLSDFLWVLEGCTWGICSCLSLEDACAGESCKILGEFDNRLRDEIVSAVFDQDFEKAATLATIGDSLTPFRSLCRISTGDASENKERQ